MIEDTDATGLGPTPGLPEDAFEHDGLITKRLLRAAALAHLRPRPGERLWDLGAGAGSVSVEWCRAAERTSAVAVERDPIRADRIRRNSARLTRAGAVEVIVSAVDEALVGLVGRAGVKSAELGQAERPDAVFVGGGLTMAVLQQVFGVLAIGGRVVAHGITLEAEQVCLAAHQRWGGQLSRMQVEQAEPLGRFTGWTPQRTLVQWALVRSQ